MQKLQKTHQYTAPKLAWAWFYRCWLDNPDNVIYEPIGCNECREGYKGRVGIYEVMKVSPDISRIIMEDGNAIDIKDAALKNGFRDLRRSGILKVLQGVTSIQEMMRVTSE